MVWNNLSQVTFMKPHMFSFGTLFLFLFLHFVSRKAAYFSGSTFLDNPFIVWQSIHISPSFCVCLKTALLDIPLLTWTECLVSNRQPASYWYLFIQFGLSKFSVNSRFWRKTHRSKSAWEIYLDNACKICLLGVWIACYFSNASQHFSRTVSSGFPPSWDWRILLIILAANTFLK